MMKLSIASRLGDYEVVFSRGFDFFEELGAIDRKVVVVDRQVSVLYHDRLARFFPEEEIVLFDALEQNKVLDAVGALYEQLIQRQAKKNLTLISVGGGITQDVTGFVASTIYRGLDWIFIPTTLLAQADSCIGSKTSLNYKRYKNLIGTFYPPRRVFINPAFLETLSREDIYSGLGEVIKLQLMKEVYPKDIDSIIHVDREEWKKPDKMLDLIHECLGVKVGYMENDEFDRGRRNLLNYGHCFGHALETTSDYVVPHGVAVVVGMIFANAVSVNRGWLSPDMHQRLNEEILCPCIPITLQPDHFNGSALLECIRNDKKRIGSNLTMIIPDHDLRVRKVDAVTETEFARTLDDVMALLLPGGRPSRGSSPKFRKGVS